MRRSSGIIGGIVAAVCIAASAASVQAQSFPARPVRLLIVQAAGGSTDTVARGYAEELRKLWGQAVVVENRPGASGVIGTEMLVRSEPDGHTLLLASNAQLVHNAVLAKNLPFDLERDLAPIFNAVEAPTVVVVHPSVAANSMRELIALAKASPGTLNNGTPGINSGSHIDSELFSAQTGIRLFHVPYKSGTDSNRALFAGDVQVGFSVVGLVLPGIRDGRLRALGIASPERTPVLPNVPTFAEAGYGEIRLLGNYWGFVATARTPKALVDKIAADLATVSSQPAFREKFITGLGFQSPGDMPAAFAERMRKDRAQLVDVAKSAGLKGS